MKPGDKNKDMINESDTDIHTNHVDALEHFRNLIEDIDDEIDYYLKIPRPVCNILMRARTTLKDQHTRIGEIFEVLERQNKEIEKLREALESADECLALIEDVGHGLMMDNVTVARGIINKAICKTNTERTRGANQNQP